ncbi:Plasmodium vivax Vir protein, putative [Plasmodium ovale]|uniref:Plasmodium vivax Vir protein, putative n=1 Tax=Plasmodium ovale TaxID=36330 RepID=A0A1C3KGT7_PLAOA|nr:Plasmodium vivax Vir protein, putative [Plasmodium ovale]
MDKLQNIENDAKLGDLPSYKAYLELDKIPDSYLDHDYCYYTKNYDVQYTGFSGICKKLANALKYIYDKESIDSNKSKLCRYLSFWIHEKVRNIDINKSNISYKWYMWLLKNSWVNINAKLVTPGGYSCNPEFYNIDMQDIIKRKNLYGYCENYDDIIRKVFKDDDCKNYYDYLKRMKILHKEFKKVWSVDNGQIPHFIKDCENNDPAVSLMTPSCRNEKIQRGTEEESEEDGDYFPVFLDDNDRLQQVGENPSNAMSIVLPLFGISLSFFLVYKFTTFGSKLRTILLRNNIIKRATHDELTEAFSTHSNEIFNGEMYNDYLKIGYANS